MLEPITIVTRTSDEILGMVHIMYLFGVFAAASAAAAVLDGSALKTIVCDKISLRTPASNIELALLHMTGPFLIQTDEDRVNWKLFTSVRQTIKMAAQTNYKKMRGPCETKADEDLASSSIALAECPWNELYLQQPLLRNWTVCFCAHNR